MCQSSGTELCQGIVTDVPLLCERMCAFVRGNICARVVGKSGAKEL